LAFAAALVTVCASKIWSASKPLGIVLGGLDLVILPDFTGYMGFPLFSAAFRYVPLWSFKSDAFNGPCLAFFAALVATFDCFFTPGVNKVFLAAGFDEAFFAVLDLVVGLDGPCLAFFAIDLVVVRRSRTRSEEPPWGVGSAVTSAMSTASRATREKSDQRMVDVDGGIKRM